MESLGYYNGKIGLIEEIQIPMSDRACYFGDGIYDATLGLNHIISFLDEHLDRFYNSANLLKMVVPLPREELADLLRSLIKRVAGSSHIVYWQLTRGTALRNHLFPKDSKSNLWVMISSYSLSDVEKKNEAHFC